MPGEANLQAADQMMALGAQTLAQSIKTDADAIRAEKVMRMEDIIVNKLIPMKEEKRIDSRQFIKAAISAGHKLGLDREDSLGAVLSLEKVDQLLQSRANTSIKDYWDLRGKKANVRLTEQKLQPQGMSEKELNEIELQRQRIAKGQREAADAQTPLVFKKVKETIAKAAADNILDTKAAIVTVQNFSEKARNMSADDKLEYLNDELADVYEGAGLEGWFGSNQARSLPHLAEILAIHLYSDMEENPEFQAYTRDNIQKALLELFVNPDTDIGGSLGTLLKGAPKAKGRDSYDSLGTFINRRGMN